MKERLRIGREKDRARRITQKLQEENERLSETEDHENQCLATLKRLKRCDDNELERKLRLEKVVARLAVETEEERRADGSYQMAQVGHGDGRRKKSKTGEDDSYHTAQVGPGDRGRKKSNKWIGYDLD